MITFIFGGSGSGKSAYAEQYLYERAEGKPTYYIATMQVYDDEGRRKIERHRQLRSQRGFLTIEQPRDIEQALMRMKKQSGAVDNLREQSSKIAQTVGNQQEEKYALLECMSNLVANEMFSGETPKSARETITKISRGLLALEQELTELVIVGNNVFEDGVQYDDTTMEYLRAMGELHQDLAARASRVIELVVGIPIVHANDETLLCG